MAYHRIGQGRQGAHATEPPQPGFRGRLGCGLPAQVPRQGGPNANARLRPGRLCAYREARKEIEGPRGFGASSALDRPRPWPRALGQWDEATACVARAIALRPKDVAAAAGAQPSAGQAAPLGGGPADLDEVLRQHADDGNVWFERGRMYAQQERWDLAAADFNQALERPPFSSNSGLDAAFPSEMLQPDAAFDALARLRPHDAAPVVRHA